MSNILVANATQLLRAVQTAKSGDVILLSAGNYGSVNLTGFKFGGNVTIASADASKPAIFTGMMVNNSTGLTLKGLDFYVQPGKDLPFQVANSSQINLDSLNVHGSLNGSSSDDSRGLIVRTSSDVTVTNSHFSELTDAVTQLNNSNISFTNNTFETIRDDGIVGGGTSNLTIKNNYFTNFDHVGDVHPDAIQVWTTNTTTVASNITISGNVFERGTGSAVQGIFMSDPSGKLPFENVTISGNTIVGALYNGISVDGAKNLVVSNNTVLAYEGQDSWIRLQATSGPVSVLDNVASAYTSFDAGVVHIGNVVLGKANDMALVALSTMTQAHLAAADLGSLAHALSGEIFQKVATSGYVDGASTTSSLASYFTTTVVNGTDGADRLSVGAVGNYELNGGAGNDTLTGRDTGTHKLIGGMGDDNYNVFGTGDTVTESAGGGTDTVVSHINYTLAANVENLRAGEAGLELHGNGLDNSILGSIGVDHLYGEGGNDVIQGGDGTDWIYGGAGDDRVYGGAGNDMLFGDDGNDSVIGGAGDDYIYGGAGNDTLEGGAGKDVLTGGSGSDTFLFRPGDFDAGVTASRDTITDFNRAEGDKISLSLLDANIKTAADDAFRFIGNEGFHKIAGELHYEAANGGVLVAGDTNGDGIADFNIFVAGIFSLNATDFYL